MAKVKRSILINAPVEAVQEITDDPNRMPDWYVGVEEVQSDGTFPNVGGKVDAVYKAAGITFTLQQTSIEYEPGKRGKFEFEGMITGFVSDTLESEGDATRYTMDFDYQMPGGGVGKVVDKLVVERMNTQQLEQSLENLKALVEK